MVREQDAPIRFGAVRIVVAMAWLGLADGLSAQQTFQFQFRPPVGSRLVVVANIEGELVFRDVPFVEVDTVGNFTSFATRSRTVVEDLGDASVVSFTYDSSYAQYRVRPGGGWIELRPRQGKVGPYRWLVDHHLQRALIDPPPDVWDLNVASGLTGMVELPLPEEPVVIGERWPVSFQFPFTTQVPSRSPLIIAIALPAQGVAVVDSVVARATDTLAYVTASVGVGPTTVPAAFGAEGGDLPVQLSGSVTASLIWSTGWQAWVSGIQTIKIDHRVRVSADDDAVAPTMQSNLTSRFRIRP
jgi:hypothetical protein